MDQNEQGTIKDIVKVIYHSRGDWRTPGALQEISKYLLKQ